MLAQLTINNFTIVHELEVQFQNGMTVITGETGAGKSVALDALSLCLGERADATMIRPDAKRADICALFTLADNPAALRWLQANELDEGQECLLRRTISRDGRSRAFINGTAVPLSQLRALGRLLIHIHSQHAHQQLLQADYQQHLLDTFADQEELLGLMKTRYQRWHQACQTLAQLQQQAEAREAHKELLTYQLQELESFQPQEGEFEAMEEEYRLLSSGSLRLAHAQQLLQHLSEDDSQALEPQLRSLQPVLNELIVQDKQLDPLAELLDSVIIQLSEMSDELRHYCDRIELDPNRLYELEQRISGQIALARKHKVAPAQLPAHYAQLQAELDQLDNAANERDHLSAQIQRLHQDALATATLLQQQREHAARRFAEQITKHMHTLAMPHGQCVIDVRFTPDRLTEQGASQVALLVRTNPGQPLQALAKVVSGGELSRIALATQVIAAQKAQTPAMIFDEVDVGISGPTAAIVGKMLRQLGDKTQVLCVTHLPQVAGCGHQHLFVSKETDGKVTQTHITTLDKTQRLNEIARMLGGSTVTRNTLANARELLAA